MLGSPVTVPRLRLILKEYGSSLGPLWTYPLGCSKRHIRGPQKSNIYGIRCSLFGTLCLCIYIWYKIVQSMMYAVSPKQKKGCSSWQLSSQRSLTRPSSRPRLATSSAFSCSRVRRRVSPPWRIGRTLLRLRSKASDALDCLRNTWGSFFYLMSLAPIFLLPTWSPKQALKAKNPPLATHL